MSAIARRYARAAFEAVTEKGNAQAADALAANLQAFSREYAGSPELQEALRNPVFKQNRAALLDALLAKIEVKGTAVRLIRLLAANERIESLSDVAFEVEALADERAGRLRARVQSAVALSDAQRLRLSQALQKRLGRPVAVQVHVEPGLLGGLVCQVGGHTFDSSLKRQLEILTERLGAHA